tara:strand:+ start:111 stop:323 length:213 start_codon:yes stop_codon:yes gene_type:complete
VELERDVADCVGEIPDYEDAGVMSGIGDGWDVEELAGVELNAWEEQDSGFWTMLFDDGDNVGGRKGWLRL